MSSMTRAVTYADLERLLIQIGFTAARSGQGYRVFRHTAPDALIILPSRSPEDPVDASHLIAVRKHVIENGLLDVGALDALLRGSDPAAASQ